MFDYKIGLNADGFLIEMCVFLAFLDRILILRDLVQFFKNFDDFGLLFSKPTIFAIFGKKNVLDPNGPYISTIQAKIKKCLSVCNFGILSVVCQ